MKLRDEEMKCVCNQNADVDGKRMKRMLNDEIEEGRCCISKCVAFLLLFFVRCVLVFLSTIDVQFLFAFFLHKWQMITEYCGRCRGNGARCNAHCTWMPVGVQLQTHPVEYQQNPSPFLSLSPLLRHWNRVYRICCAANKQPDNWNGVHIVCVWIEVSRVRIDKWKWNETRRSRQSQRR